MLKKKFKFIIFSIFVCFILYYTFTPNLDDIFFLKNIKCIEMTDKNKNEVHLETKTFDDLMKDGKSTIKDFYFDDINLNLIKYLICSLLLTLFSIYIWNKE